MWEFGGRRGKGTLLRMIACGENGKGWAKRKAKERKEKKRNEKEKLKESTKEKRT